MSHYALAINLAHTEDIGGNWGQNQSPTGLLRARQDKKKIVKERLAIRWFSASYLGWGCGVSGTGKVFQMSLFPSNVSLLLLGNLKVFPSKIPCGHALEAQSNPSSIGSFWHKGAAISKGAPSQSTHSQEFMKILWTGVFPRCSKSIPSTHLGLPMNSSGGWSDDFPHFNAMTHSRSDDTTIKSIINPWPTMV